MARRRTLSSPPRTVQIEFDEKTYTGSYAVDRKMITVSYGWRTKTTQLGGSASAPDSLARIMLAEMVREERDESRPRS